MTPDDTMAASKIVVDSLRASRDRETGKVDYVYALGLMAGEVLMAREALAEAVKKLEVIGSEK